VTSRVPEVREAIDRAGSDALLLVDTISSLGSIDYRHDEWGVDVTVGCSQKGLMLPAGLGFNAVSAKALAASSTARLPRSYWDWGPILEANRAGFWPYTSATNLLYGLREALVMLREEGLEHVFARHRRHAEATRAAVRAWGLEVLCADEREYSASLTAALVPEGVDADEVRRVILERFDMSLGAGLGKLAGKVFRIGHLGDLNDLMLAGTLCGVEMGLRLAGVPASGGVDAALERLALQPVPA
jgi:alanine-glyoxylate transaminase / serine-glyoxylate transaminase / serine-pyruvate transaminase